MDWNTASAVVSAFANVAMAAAAVWAAKWQWPRQTVKNHQFALAGKYLSALDSLDRDLIAAKSNASVLGPNTEPSRNSLLLVEKDLLARQSTLQELTGEVGIFFPPSIHLLAAKATQSASLAIVEVQHYAEGLPSSELEIGSRHKELVNSFEKIDLEMRRYLWQMDVLPRSERYSTPEWQAFVADSVHAMERGVSRIKKHFPAS